MAGTITSLVWLRQDLRVADNPALAAAMKNGPTAALYILDDRQPWPPGGASRWWLHHSLKALTKDLAALGVPLILRRGDSSTMLRAVVGTSGCRHVMWNRCYEPHAIERDTALKEKLTVQGIKVESFNGSLLFEPWTIKNKTGGFYKVYTPFSKACMTAEPPPAPLPAPKRQPAVTLDTGDALDDWQLLPTHPNWAKGFDAVWTPGSKGAVERLHAFVDHILRHYADGRDRPDRDYTSRLSPHLHFGDISPRQAWHTVTAKVGDANAEKFLKELLWREFNHHLLYHLPHMPEKPLDQKFLTFPWQPDKNLVDAWKRGQTGYPIVDAGMRQLWQTGWMHNRVRMVCASLLVKHLLQPWQAGAAWFWDTLVDADLANNSGGWQWVAGSGADASPYYRIFNPMLQGAKFDPEGDYVREFVPELAKLPAKFIHAPWTAPTDVLEAAGIQLGKTYPAPVVDHETGRKRALEALKDISA